MRAGLLMALMAVAGLQIIPVLIMGVGGGFWLGQVEWWNDAVASWPSSLLWVPHHVAGAGSSVSCDAW